MGTRKIFYRSAGFGVYALSALDEGWKEVFLIINVGVRMWHAWSEDVRRRDGLALLAPYQDPSHLGDITQRPQSVRMLLLALFCLAVREDFTHGARWLALLLRGPSKPWRGYSWFQGCADGSGRWLSF